MDFKKYVVYLSFLGLFGCGLNPNLQISKDMPMNGDHFKVGEIDVTIEPINSQTIKQIKKQQKKIHQELLKYQNKYPAYRAQCGDSLVITVWDRPDLNNPFGNVLNSGNLVGHYVDSDGCIYYPYIGRIKISGLDINEIRQLICKKLSVYVKDPQIDVKFLNYRGQLVYVQGAVQKMGSIQISDVPMTIAEAMTQSGGYSSSADLSQVKLIRGAKTYSIDLLDTFEEGDNAFQILLENRDFLKIPFQSESNIYVFGSVNKIGPVNAGPHRLSLKDALSSAGGVSIGGDLKQVYVIRQEEGNCATLFHLNCSSPVSLIHASNFILKPKDIVYVEQNSAASYATIISTLIPFLETPGRFNTAWSNLKDLKNNLR
jgi:polysaccharide export outer membrane protein